MLMLNEEWQAATSGSVLAQFRLFTSMKLESLHCRTVEKTTYRRKALLHADRLACNVFMLEANLRKRNRWGVSVMKVVPDQMVSCLPVWEKASASTYRAPLSACQIGGCIMFDSACTASLSKKSENSFS